MSVINQMLRDLDARGAAPTDFPVGQGLAEGDKPRPAARGATWLFMLLAACALGGYAALPGTSSKGASAAPAGMARQGPDSVRVAELPSTQDSQQAVHEPPMSQPALVATRAPTSPQMAAPKPVFAHAETKVPTAPVIRQTRSLGEGLPSVAVNSAISQPPVAAVTAQAEPAVVKKMAELPPEVEAQRAYDDAQLLRRTGNIDAAIAKYRQALERNPGMRNVRIQLAEVLQGNGQPDVAFALLKAGYERQADDGLAIAVGRLLADQGRRDESLTWLERGSGGLRPADHALMGALLAQAQHYEEAVTAYRHALVTEPHQGGWLLGYGLALESLGRVDEAQVAYRNALEYGTFKPDVIGFLRQKIRMPSASAP